MKINPQNMKWFVRFALIALLAGAADVLVMLYANRPYPGQSYSSVYSSVRSCIHHYSQDEG